MLKIKTLFMFILLLGITGCVTSSNYYVLSIAPQPTTHYANKSRSIGVKKVTIPEYLYKREIAVAKTSSHISLLSGAVWGEDLKGRLLRRSNKDCAGKAWGRFGPLGTRSGSGKLYPQGHCETARGCQHVF